MSACLAYAEDYPFPGSPSVLEDPELLVLMARGVGEAMSELHDRHSRQLLALGLRLLGNRQDAEEVLQETFLYAWNKAAGYDPGRSSVPTWLWLITRCRCLDFLRRRRRIGRLHSEIEKEEMVTQSDPEGFTKVLRRERGALLRQAIDRLPEAQRQVVELHFFRGLTQTEVAEQIGIPLGTVKTRALLAKKRMRKYLDGCRELV